MLRRLPLFLLVTVVLLAPLALHAQDATSTPVPLRVGSVGLLAADGSVNYSVLLASGTDSDLTNLTITSAMPEGATFVDVFWTPEAAIFVGETDGIVTWTLPELAADSLIGPFTYQVTFDEADADMPYTIPASVSWDEGEASATLSERELPVYDSSGSITLDETGTDGLVAVGNTGVYIEAPAGAFDQEVTLTFERLPLDAQNSGLPEVDADIWWCTLFQVTVEPAGVEARQPVTILYPTVRTLTPGLEVLHFIQPADGAWTLWETEPSPALVTPGGNHVISVWSGAAPGGTFTLTAGVATQKRGAAVAANVSGLAKTPGWVDPDTEPWVEPDVEP